MSKTATPQVSVKSVAFGSFGKAGKLETVYALPGHDCAKGPGESIFWGRVARLFHGGPTIRLGRVRYHTAGMDALVQVSYPHYGTQSRRD